MKRLAPVLLLALPAAAQEAGREAVILSRPGGIDAPTAMALMQDDVVIRSFAGEGGLIASVPDGMVDAKAAELSLVFPGLTIEPLPAEMKTRALMAAPETDGGDPDALVLVEVEPALGSPDGAVEAVLARFGEVQDGAVEIVDANAREGWIVSLPRRTIPALAALPIVEALRPLPDFPLID